MNITIGIALYAKRTEDNFIVYISNQKTITTFKSKEKCPEIGSFLLVHGNERQNSNFVLIDKFSSYLNSILATYTSQIKTY
jgi:hypothetical protein